MAELRLTYQDRTHDIAPDGRVFRIGRDPANDLVLAFPFVSSIHGIIFWDKHRFVYKDEKSTNGTWLKTRETLPTLITRAPLPDAGILYLGRPDPGPHLAFSIVRQPLLQTDGLGQKISKGRQWLSSGEYENALALFDGVIDREPGYLMAYYYAGFAASKCKLYDHAILRFEQYLSHRQDDTDTMTDLGWLYEQTGRIEKAANCYNKAILGGNHAWARQCLDNLSRFRHLMPGKTRELLISREHNHLQTDHFRVFFNIQVHMDRIKPVLKYCEMAYQDMGADWHIYPVPLENSASDKITVTLADSDTSDHGRTRGKKIILYLTPDGHAGDKFLEILVRHEYAHFVLGWVTQFSSVVPWWIHEGFAQFVSQNIVKDRLTYIAGLVSEDKLLPLEALETDIARLRIPDLKQIAYLQAHAGVAFFIRQHGKAAFMKLVEQIQTTGNTSRAFKQMGLDYNRFERLFSDWLMQGSEKGRISMTRKTGYFNHGA